MFGLDTETDFFYGSRYFNKKKTFKEIYRKNLNGMFPSATGTWDCNPTRTSSTLAKIIHADLFRMCSDRPPTLKEAVAAIFDVEAVINKELISHKFVVRTKDIILAIFEIKN